MPRATARDSRPLSLDAIVGAAVGLIEERGLEALTMRSLAERCGASPMSLYRHVATKEDLLRAIVERELADVEIPDTEGLPWREAIMRVTLSVQRGFLSHPYMAEILARQHADVLAVFRATEVILRALRTAGLDDRAAVAALDTITACAAGYTQRKADLRRRERAPDDRLRLIRELPREEFGTVVELAGLIVTVDFEHGFEDGLELVLDGIERRIEQRARRAS